MTENQYTGFPLHASKSKGLQTVSLTLRYFVNVAEINVLRFTKKRTHDVQRSTVTV